MCIFSLCLVIKRGMLVTPLAQGSYAHALSLSCHLTRHASNSFGLLAQDYCERKTSTLEKTTSSVLSVLFLIYGPTKDKHKILII